MHYRNPSDASFSFLVNNTRNIDDSSISLGINKLSEASVSPLGQNSVYELVENTNYRRKATATGLLTITSSPTSINVKGPTTRDIPPTVLSKIKKVKDEQFRPYLNTIQDAYSEFRSHKTLTESTLEAFMTQLSNEERRKEKARNAADASVNTDYGLTEEEEAQMDSNSLTHVPKVYFSNDFRLDDPRVFDEVVGGATILRDTVEFSDDGQQKPLVDNEEVQDKLSSYLDIVEIHLIHEISKSSGSFFSALGDLKDITQQSDALTVQLHDVDTKLEKLSENRAQGAIEMLRLTQKRNNVEKLEQALLQINEIMHQADLAESSYFNANYEKALELTEAVFCLIRGNAPDKNEIVNRITLDWPYPLLDMSKVPALVPLKRLLVNLIADTGKSFAKLFGDFLIEDLRSCYENASRSEVMSRLASNITRDDQRNNSNAIPSVPSYLSLSPEFKDRVRHYISGLARCGELASAYKLYEERFLTELKTIIRSFLPNDVLEGSSGRSGTSVSGRSDESRTTTTQRSGVGRLSGIVRAMTPKEFEDLLIGTYTQLSEALRRLTTHKKLLLELALDCLAEQNKHFMDEQSDLIVQLDITDGITAAINISQRRMAKIINVREVQNSCVTLDYFLRFYSVNSMFLFECELVSGGRIGNPVLQDIINIQFQKFNVQYHRASLKILTSKVEKEIWRECLLPASLQRLTNQIVDAASDEFDKSVWLDAMNLQLQQKGVESEKPEGDDVDEGSRKTLTIEEKSFIVPEVVSTVLTMIQSYEIIKLQFPIVENGNLIELLKLLNLKIHQSVLGAQATRTAGLRNITSKHLAVTSQLLGFIGALIPYTKNLFERLSRAGTFSPDEFNRAQQMFADQQIEIFDKLVSIMVDRVNSQSIDIRKTDWSNPLPHQQVHHYMEDLVSKTLTIARILQRYLPESQYTHILSRIFEQYKQALTSIYSQVRLKDSVDKAVMMRDVDYFREKLVDVPGYSNSGLIIWENVNSMATDEDSRIQQPQMQSFSGLERRRPDTVGKSEGNGNKETASEEKPGEKPAEVVGEEKKASAADSATVENPSNENTEEKTAEVPNSGSVETTTATDSVESPSKEDTEVGKETEEKKDENEKVEREKTETEGEVKTAVEEEKVVTEEKVESIGVKEDAKSGDTREEDSPEEEVKEAEIGTKEDSKDPADDSTAEEAKQADAEANEDSKDPSEEEEKISLKGVNEDTNLQESRDPAEDSTKDEAKEDMKDPSEDTHDPPEEEAKEAKIGSKVPPEEGAKIGTKDPADDRTADEPEQAKAKVNEDTKDPPEEEAKIGTKDPPEQGAEAGTRGDEEGATLQETEDPGKDSTNDEAKEAEIAGEEDTEDAAQEEAKIAGKEDTSDPSEDPPDQKARIDPSNSPNADEAGGEDEAKKTEQQGPSTKKSDAAKKAKKAKRAARKAAKRAGKKQSQGRK
ncbi:DEKNAAC101410 [Brettanomyces naardenensis]|uniref:DEKNAAC101410 n=1 Tax=Brettanomyces naardenensis TaxID=13370 RepID=A0A448YI58_BRENA|nr:DEKNAAC101410 [Brettanomyces naardenensis]